MSAKPTAAELRQAGEIRDDVFDALKRHNGPTPREVIAQALADQRARYEAVADELEAEAMYGEGGTQRREAVQRIRQVAQ